MLPLALFVYPGTQDASQCTRGTQMFLKEKFSFSRYKVLAAGSPTFKERPSVKVQFWTALLAPLIELSKVFYLTNVGCAKFYYISGWWKQQHLWTSPMLLHPRESKRFYCLGGPPRLWDASAWTHLVERRKHARMRDGIAALLI